MQISKDMVYGLEPTLSGSPMVHLGDKGMSSYRGHLTCLAKTGDWVAWVEYERADGPGVERAPVTHRATSLPAATAALNDRLRTKQHNNRSGRLYQPVRGATGEITEAIFAEYNSFVLMMDEAMDQV